jgi:fumarate reductase flavoprotein subunit
MRAWPHHQHGGVYIKMGHLGPDKVAKQFKGMVERCADCGFDLAGGLVEVVPTAHYFMGGLVCASTRSPSCRACSWPGEDAGGVHGANRLAATASPTRRCSAASPARPCRLDRRQPRPSAA